VLSNTILSSNETFQTLSEDKDEHSSTLHVRSIQFALRHEKLFQQSLCVYSRSVCVSSG